MRRLMFCIILLVSLANSGVYEVSFEVYLLGFWWCEQWQSYWWFTAIIGLKRYEDKYSENANVAAFNPIMSIMILFQIVFLCLLFRFTLSMSPRWVESLLIFFHEISRHVDDVNWRNSYLISLLGLYSSL